MWGERLFSASRVTAGRKKKKEERTNSTIKGEKGSGGCTPTRGEKKSPKCEGIIFGRGGGKGRSTCGTRQKRGIGNQETELGVYLREGH